MINGENKVERVLAIYQMLTDGESVNKRELADRFHVNERTIQRDIEDIRVYLEESQETVGGSGSIVYKHKEKGFRLVNDVKKMSGGELLAVSKILLESRAFTKEELEPIMEKLVFNCVPPSERKQAGELLSNERYHYIEPHHHTRILHSLWELGGAVRTQRYVKIWYKKLSEEKPVVRTVKPVGIMFSEFYFYLIAFIERKADEPEYLSPAIYRVDRIQSYKILNDHFFVPYKDRFEEGEFRKRVQFMFGGRLQRIIFEYSGMSLEAVLDRLPTAVVLEERKEEETGKKIYTIRAEVFGNGIDMWIRGQGENVKVISKKIQE